MPIPHISAKPISLIMINYELASLEQYSLAKEDRVVCKLVLLLLDSARGWTELGYIENSFEHEWPLFSKGKQVLESTFRNVYFNFMSLDLKKKKYKRSIHSGDETWHVKETNERKEREWQTLGWQGGLRGWRKQRQERGQIRKDGWQMEISPNHQQ